MNMVKPTIVEFVGKEVWFELREQRVFCGKVLDMRIDPQGTPVVIEVEQGAESVTIPWNAIQCMSYTPFGHNDTAAQPIDQETREAIVDSWKRGV